MIANPPMLPQHFIETREVQRHETIHTGVCVCARAHTLTHTHTHTHSHTHTHTLTHTLTHTAYTHQSLSNTRQVHPQGFEEEDQLSGRPKGSGTRSSCRQIRTIHFSASASSPSCSTRSSNSPSAVAGKKSNPCPFFGFTCSGRFQLPTAARRDIPENAIRPGVLVP